MKRYEVTALDATGRAQTFTYDADSGAEATAIFRARCRSKRVRILSVREVA